ncbi:hypothetical protein J4Q44_G00340760, partial [Coregonus suidteri]
MGSARLDSVKVTGYLTVTFLLNCSSFFSNPQDIKQYRGGGRRSHHFLYYITSPLTMTTPP